ncbi:methyltransferase domain-containing protein [Gordonia sp. SID5947]|uniref:class I SAM-dependent methyltransferase n=1 Tax=Gordonia sp. SID5947 TaxID=2690315 RepID=UPI00136D4868|nr:class I SAM-dependent methyltransferase [Gordonia sp. SID5947]MYR05431.1 methyltransferase domain-containing protein [Gordonia sp. SID5947]
MRRPLSDRLAAVVDALPLRPGIRVLEVGCGPGAAAREVARRVGPLGHVLAIDRSERAIRRAISGSTDLIASGVIEFCCAAVEELRLPDQTPPFDLAFAIRVGAFDGRHPEIAAAALVRVQDVLVPNGQLWVDVPDGTAAVVSIRPSPGGSGLLDQRGCRLGQR